MTRLQFSLLGLFAVTTAVAVVLGFWLRFDSVSRTLAGMDGTIFAALGVFAVVTAVASVGVWWAHS